MKTINNNKEKNICKQVPKNFRPQVYKKHFKTGNKDMEFLPVPVLLIFNKGRDKLGVTSFQFKDIFRSRQGRVLAVGWGGGSYNLGQNKKRNRSPLPPNQC